MADLKSLETAAAAYLKQQLGPRAPSELTFAGVFNESPLETEGEVALFAFELAPSGPAATCAGDPRHFVVVGQTSPNYFPAYDLAPSDAYSLHLGTRFLLEMGLERIDISEEREQHRAAIREFVQGCNPQATVGGDELVLLFRAEEQHFAVYRVLIESVAYFCMGGDLPHGFYPAEKHPPQAFLRLHLGRVIREEAQRRNPNND